MSASKAIRLGGRLRELRLHFCQTAAESNGAREFVEKFYVPLKKANPTFPILVRECSGVQAKVHARYGRGEESHVSLSGMSGDQVMKVVEQLASK